MELRPYQLSGVDFLTEVRRGILADGMGVGKTPQLIRAARGDTLVVAPAGLVGNWKREIAAWASDDGPWPTPDQFTVTSYHSLVDSKRKDAKGHVLGVPKHPFKVHPKDTLIFDEAHHLKGRHTGYARAGVTLASNAPRLFYATGTPVRNWAHEIFMILRGLYPGDKRFTSYWRWAERWFTVADEVVYRKGKRQEHRTVGVLRDITTWDEFVEQNGLRGKVLRRTVDDPEVDIELPELQVIPVYTEMGPTQRKAYRGMERKFLAHYRGKTVISTSHGSQWTNLMRLTSGLCFHPELRSGPSSKLSAFEDLLVDVGSDQLLVFAHFHETIEGLVEWCDEQGISAEFVHGGMSATQQDLVVQSWQNGHVQILVGSFGTISEGLNLTQANKLVIFETPPVPATYDQALARIRRFGQTRKCTAWSLIAADSTDSYYFDRVLPAKRAQSDGLVRAAIEADDVRQYLGRQ